MDIFLSYSVVFIYMYAVLNVLGVNLSIEKNRIYVFYILTYVFLYTGKISFVQIVFSSLIVLFIYNEYLYKDENKRYFICSLKDRIGDFLFYIFHIKIEFFYLSLFILSLKDKNIEFGSIELKNEFKQLVVVCSVIILMILFNSLSTGVEFNDYEVVISKIRLFPYYKFVENRDWDNTNERLNLLVDVEDRFYFSRKSVTFLSMDYARNYIYEELGVSVRDVSFFEAIRNKVGNVQNLYDGIMTLKRIMVFMYENRKNICQIIRKVNRQLFKRGHSTIEMQLYRTIMYKSRPVVSKKKSPMRYWRMTITRKIYELYYTPIFIKGIERYVQLNGSYNLRHFREYILFLYFNSVISWRKGKRYFPLSKYFDEQDLGEWCLEELFLLILMLPKNVILKDRVDRYSGLIGKYSMDYSKIYCLLDAK